MLENTLTKTISTYFAFQYIVWSPYSVNVGQSHAIFIFKYFFFCFLFEPDRFREWE